MPRKHVVKIECKNAEEKESIERAMSDVSTRAFVLIVGTLLALPSDRARTRVLSFVADKLDEAQGSIRMETSFKAGEESGAHSVRVVGSRPAH